MSKRIPIKAARDFARTNNLQYVVIFARSRGVSHVVTYGNSIEESEAAAKLGNQMKRGLGWPEKLQAMPARVTRDQKKIANAIADALFVEGSKRLVLETNKKLEGGGWCRSAVVDQIIHVLRFA